MEPLIVFKQGMLGNYLQADDSSLTIQWKRGCEKRETKSNSGLFYFTKNNCNRSFKIDMSFLLRNLELLQLRLSVTVTVRLTANDFLITKLYLSFFMEGKIMFFSGKNRYFVIFSVIRFVEKNNLFLTQDFFPFTSHLF